MLMKDIRLKKKKTHTKNKKKAHKQDLTATPSHLNSLEHLYTR